MSTQITIQGTVITFPTSSDSPNWAESIDAFATAVEEALASAVGPFDVAPQALTIDPYNPGTNIDITALSFPTANVREVLIEYAVFRTTTTSVAGESGEISIFYNPQGPVGNKWNMAQKITSNINGGGLIRFNVEDTGQVQFSTQPLSGSNHTGKLSFSAKCILQS